MLQGVIGPNAANALTSFDGSDNDDNLTTVGFRVAPPDTDGDVGPNHYVQMINLITTIFNKSGGIVPDGGPFPSSAFWTAIGGNCGTYNQGDPVVLYDETNDRWLVSQFAFDSQTFAASTYAQCVAVSQTGDPTGAYNRYEFSFATIGFPDYPKHGIATDSVTIMANLFGFPPFNPFTGTFVGAIDKVAMYAGATAQLVGFNLGTGEFGFVAGDLDDAAGTAGFVPALFATAMSRNNLFDIWQVDPDFAGGGAGASANRIAAIPIAAYDADLCVASREACIPQPSPGTSLEAISDRLMHRLQIRDFGSYRTMVTGHTVDVGGGRAGIRWYEMRESGGGWGLHQQGTFGPADGENRWMPSVAMNAAGDIGIGYLLSSSSTFMSTAFAGQTAANSGTGTLDAAEEICIAGTGAQTSTARSGDYSATSIDPSSDTFWHTNEFGRVTGSFEWATRVCEFSLEPPPPATDVHVQSIVTGTQSAGRGRQNGTATVTIFDDSGNPVGAGYTVEGNFSGTFNESASAVTDANGVAFLVTTGSAKKNIVVNFCVSDVLGALPYDPNDNASPSFDCGSTPTPTDVHVENIVTGTQGVGGGNKVGTATVTIFNDTGGSAGAGYTVTGNFSGDIAETGVTGVTQSNGTVTLQTSGTARGKVNISFCVSNVSGGALPYDPNDNTPGTTCSP